MPRADRVSAKEFVKTWQKAKSIDDVVTAFGGKATSYRTRAISFRKKGIPMKKFPSAQRGAPLDIEALTALAKSLGGSGETTKKAKK
jgi:hypothetical protein